MLSDPASDLLHPVQSDEFLPPIGLWNTLGGLFLVGTVGVAVTLASVIQYNITVKAAATVRPTGELRIVQAATTGTVKSIDVKGNQVVKKGDAIAHIDNSQLQIQKSLLQGSIQQDKSQLAQVKAQINALNIQTLAQSSLMNRTVAAAQADLKGNQRNYKDQQIITQIEVQEAEEALEIARSQLKAVEPLAKQGVISRVQLQEKRQAFLAAQARLQRAKAAQNPTNADVAVALERIAQERANRSISLAALSKERNQLIQRQIEIQNQLGQVQKNLQQLALDLSKSVIRAPVDGTILKLELRNPGQTVSPGESIAQIAPGHAPLVIKARVAAQDISKVKLCEAEKIENCEEGKVQLRFSAYPYPDYGTLKGAVRAIPPDATTAQSSSTGASPAYYEVAIQPEKPYLKDDPRNAIRPGMDVTADIISREETVLTFILRKARLITDL